MSKDLSSNSSSSYKDTVFPKIQDRLLELFVQLTGVDLRMNEKQKKAFFRAYWDLVEQEPTLEEMEIAYKSYVAHFDHIPSPFAFAKHFNRFRSGMLPNKKGSSLKQLEEQQRELKLQQWVKEMEEQDGQS